jgi:hypothetical protein
MSGDIGELSPHVPPPARYNDEFEYFFDFAGDDIIWRYRMAESFTVDGISYDLLDLGVGVARTMISIPPDDANVARIDYSKPPMTDAELTLWIKFGIINNCKEA